MIIPRTFRVGTRLYKVQRPARMRTPHSRGATHFTAQIVDIAQESNVDGKKLSAAEVTHTFWHEALHVMLGDMGNRLTYDEAFVDALAKRLTQVIYTARF
jgi:hypothetical protein